MENAKYPRTPYLPYSPGLSSKSQVIETLDRLTTNPVIMTEKMDGSNVCLTRHHVYARSHSGPPTHPSFDFIKAWHASVRYQIPEGISLFGEYCYAIHSIQYFTLPFPFFLFGVRDDKKEEWVSWPAVETIASRLGVPTVPLLFRGALLDAAGLEKLVLEFAGQPSIHGAEREGIVVRRKFEFPCSEFELSVAKYVRPNHVQTDEHWSHQQIRKQRIGESDA